MYKTMLQEVCQQRRWAIPKYDTEKMGLDHDPRFRASVSVNGLTFTGLRECRSTKEAQNEAAAVAYTHFTSTTAPAPAPPVASSAYLSPSSQLAATGSNPCPSMPSAGLGSSSKSQLQIYAQKRNINLPLYECIHEGSLHSLRYKVKVTVDGQTFESPQSFNQLKEAENAAARIALISLSVDGDYVDSIPLYKNLLLQLAQKEGLPTPVYETSIDGPFHMPMFSSTVQIEGEKFTGIAAKTKKQAEQNAAKVAWCLLKERKSSKRTNVPANFEVCQNIKIASSGARSAATDVLLLAEVSQPETSSGSTSCVQLEDCRDGFSEESTHIEKSSGVQPTVSRPQQETAKSSVVDSEPQSDKALKVLEAEMKESLGAGSPLSPVKLESHSILNAKGKIPSSLPPCRVQVYPATTNFVLPDGGSLLPFSDDKWVAISLDSAKN